MNLNGREKLVGTNEYTEATKELKKHVSTRFDGFIPQNLAITMQNIGTDLNPFDRSLRAPLDLERGDSIRKALSYGGMLGYKLSLLACQPTTLLADDVLQSIRIHDPGDGMDELDRREIIAGQLMEKGWSGIKIAGPPTSEFLEELEERSEIRVVDQLYVRIGAGIVVSATQDALIAKLEQSQREDYARFAAEVAATGDGDIQWDEFKW